jgi:hypothetical protein
MKRAGWLAIPIGVALTIVAAWGGWRLLRPRPATMRAETLLPADPVLALRLSHFRRAWAAHWAARPGADPADAVQAYLESRDLWAPLAEAHGEAGARSRVTAYLNALFDLLGEETWFVWDAEEGALLLTREDGPLKAALAPLASLLLPGHRTRRATHRGREIARFAAEGTTRTLAMTRLEGWHCAAIGDDAAAAIEAVIDRAEAAAGDASVKSVSVRDGAEAAIAAEIQPARWIASLDPVADPNAAAWIELLDAVERLSLRQSGPSLLDLDLFIESETRFGAPLDERSAADASASEIAPDARVAPILQADLSIEFAEAELPFLLALWADAARTVEDIRLARAGLLERIDRTLTADSPTSAGRVGLAILPAPRRALPAFDIWADPPPVRRPSIVPSAHWRSLDLETIRAEGDFFESAMRASDDAATSATASAAAIEAIDRMWRDSDGPPLVFIAADWRALGEAMDAFPLLLVSSKDRPRWQRRRAFVEALTIATGSIAIEIERRDGGAMLSMRAIGER